MTFFLGVMILRFSSSLLRVMYVLLMYFFFLCTQYISEDGGARFNERSLQSLLILAKDIPQTSCVYTLHGAASAA